MNLFSNQSCLLSLLFTSRQGGVGWAMFSCPGSSIPTPCKDNRKESTDNLQEPLDNLQEPTNNLQEPPDNLQELTDIHQEPPPL